METVPKLSILLIEDDELHVELIERGFEEVDTYKLIPVDSFKKAIEVLRTQAIDLIITDLRVPDGDGITFLRENSFVDTIPVIVMTSFGDQKIAVEAMKAGALDYIVKSPESLINLPNSAKFVLKEWKYLKDKDIANKEIRDSQEKFNLFMNNLPAGVFIKDSEQKIIFTNQYFEHNFEATDWLGKPVNQLNPKINISEFLNADVEEGDFNIKTNILNVNQNDKNEKFFHTNNFAFKNQDKKTFYAGFALDITKQKEIERELIFAKEKAEEADKLKTAFLANVSHEIRTPMNAILGFSELLKSVSNPEQQNEFIDIISVNTRKLLQIITDIVDIAKMEAGQISVFKERFYLNEILGDMYNEWVETQKVIKKDTINFRVHYGFTDEGSLIETDVEKFKRIIESLLDNAFKFTEEGEISVGYNYNNERKTIQFFVRDTGIGIRDDMLSVVFEQFRQVEETFTRKFGGMGLGLSISKSMVDLLNGTIWLESVQGKGSTFYFELPHLIQVEEHFIVKELSDFQWKNKKILVVEDEFSNFQYLKEVLEPTQIGIVHITNGRDAVDYCLKNTDIDLILMDVKLPILNGIDATKLIRAAGIVTPIIAQTAFAMADDIEKCKNAGCSSYLAKPIKPSELLKVINKLI